MAIKKSLYQLLGVGPDVSPENLKAAYDAHLARFADATTPEDLSTKAILRDAFEILSDPLRRTQYDARLREERIRALSSGGEDERPRPANARPRIEIPDPDPVRSHANLLYGLAALVIACAVGIWVYFDHAHKLAAQRIEEARIAAADAKREDEERRREESLQWAKERIDADRQAAEERRRQVDFERANRQSDYEQRAQSQMAANAARRDQDEKRRAEYQRQREEQEALMRSRQQLERDRRYLQELERNRGQKF